ncbi:hypothetical protein DFQ26_006424 [Actinomortierella ambigua]|nr:hypothetical protein DFQ26_006424 [Actinomortierella ambigua]
MQEIEVPPRDVFQHYVHVDQPGKTLVWWFSTKKKNISFGLYYRKSAACPDLLKSTAVAPSILNASPPSSIISGLAARPDSSHGQHATSSSASSGASTPAHHSNGAVQAPHLLSTSPKSSRASNYSRASIDTEDEEDDDGEQQHQHQHTKSTSSSSHSQTQAQQPQELRGQPRRRRKTVAKFTDPDLVEIMPIQHYDSATGTIRGEYTVEHEGTYILIFDNSFSINTSKRLTFFVALEERGARVLTQPQVEISGWLLKKKRKRMQGWAKRWFQIENGVLSYAKDQQGPCRGKVHLVLSTVTVTQASNMIHIDTGTMLYHLKALNEEDYKTWTRVIKAAKSIGQKAVQETVVQRILSRENSVSRHHHHHHPLAGQHGSIRRSAAATMRNSWQTSSKLEVEQLKNVMASMDAGFQSIKEQLDTIQHMSGGGGNGAGGGGGAESGNSGSSPPSSLSPPSRPSGRDRQPSVDSNNAGKFRLAKFATSEMSVQSSASSDSPLDASHARLVALFTKLKADKEQAFELMRAEMEKWEKNEKQYRVLLTEKDKMAHAAATSSKRASMILDAAAAAMTAHAVPGTSSSSSAAAASQAATAAAVSSALSRQVFEEAYMQAARKSMDLDRSNSMTSSIEDSSDIFFDAMSDDDEDVQLFNADASDFEDDRQLASRGGGDGQDDDDDDDDDDNDSSDEEGGRDSCDQSQSSTLPPSQSGAPVAEDTAPSTLKEDLMHPSQPLVRRKALPAPVSGQDISLLSILRKNVGKDLSTVAMPVSLNEPINVLQRLCEELEYSELLDKAASMDDSLSRLKYVTAFAVSGYSTTQWRAARKPFNPLHGETFEYVSPERGFKFVSEKVSHYPPIMACHAQSDRGWSFAMDSRAKTKFWGKSMELIPNCTIHIEFPRTGDHYTVSKPSTWMRNLMAGTKYLDHTGQMKVTNHTTGETATMTFKESSYFGGTKHEVVGHITDSSGKKQATLQGRWSESLMEEISPNKLERLWKINSPPSGHEKYYGFSHFTMTLNELVRGTGPMDLARRLPKTDTRFRPDQALFERGEVEEADKEKLRVEQRQRELRKAMEQRGEPWQVRWFEKRDDPHTEDPEGATWHYKGGYWEARETGEWNEKITLW